MFRRLSVIGLAGLALALSVWAAYVLMSEEPAAPEAALSLAEALRSETEGFTRAVAPRPFSFPRDHGAHRGYRTEWWYYTGNLETAEGRHFGFQLTFFRVALTPKPQKRASAWGTSQVYMAHFALTDVGNRRFYAFDRLSRDALGLAGVGAQPFRVWLEGWSAQGTRERELPMRLLAAEGEVAIDLTLESAKDVVLHGDRGLSQKGAEPGNASYYYSLTRMPTRGTITVSSETFVVSGSSWMDREWSTSALEKDQVGWDWFALQLSDGRDLMFYRLRRLDGSADSRSSGTLVSADGSARSLALEDVQIEVLDHWQSPRDGTRYPSRWRLSIPAERLELEIRPYLPDQELDLAVRYWEGAVEVRGSGNGQAIVGNGYVELTGYAGRDRREL